MKRIAGLFLLVTMISGCAAFEPVIQNFNIISVPQEQQIGTQAAAEIAKNMKLVNDSSRLPAVQKIGNRLVQALPRKDFDYHFYVVDDPSPNAFTIPGGSIYVHTGLFNLAGDESELAGVMAHEVGHAYQRHPVKSISRQYGADYLQKLLLGNQQSNIKALALNMAKSGVLLKYGRSDEYEADAVGHDLLKRAGYRTDGLIRFFKKLQAIQGTGRSIPFLATHPPTPERIARLEAMEQNAASVRAG